MKSKNSIGKWTLAALLGYEFTLLAISVTPAAGKGTSFGKPGMWQNMILIAAFYLIPLVFYCLHIEAMRYILAAVIIFWTIPLPFFILISGGSFFYYRLQGDSFHSLLFLAAMSIALVSLLLQILWCVNCLRKNKKHGFI